MQNAWLKMVVVSLLGILVSFFGLMVVQSLEGQNAQGMNMQMNSGTNLEQNMQASSQPFYPGYERYRHWLGSNYGSWQVPMGYMNGMPMNNMPINNMNSPMNNMPINNMNSPMNNMQGNMSNMSGMQMNSGNMGSMPMM